MKKKMFIGGALVFLVWGVFLLGLLRTQRLRVTQTSPANAGSHNPFLPITVSFNRAADSKSVPVTISPTTDVTISNATNNSIRITPVYAFSPLTQYTIVVGTSPPFTFTFSTQQIGSNIPGWNEQMDVATREYEAKRGTQDAALENIRLNAPVQQPGFRIDYSYKNNTYTVSLSWPYETNRANFLTWLNQQGVTDLTIVRIAYINSK